MESSEERLEPTQAPESLEEETEEVNTFEDDLSQSLLKIGEQFDKEDEFFRDRQLRKLKKNLLYWEGAQRLFWAEWENTWVNAAGLITPTERNQYGFDGPVDRVINIYRPHGESIIAAMSVGTPVVQFFPDDADSTDDITTAKAYSKIATLLQKHNRASLLYIKALFILYNQGLVAGYNYTHRDPKYGQYEKTLTAPQPVPEQVESPVDGEVKEVETVIPAVVGKKSYSKVRECLEVYGPLHVAVPSWCRKQDDVPVLRLQFEQHVSTIRAAYKEHFDRINPNDGAQNSIYEKSSRLDKDTDVDESLCTLTVRWIRPSAYATLGELELFEQLLEAYPKGAKVVSLGNTILEIVNEDLDDHWTLTFPVFSETIHQEPQGSSVIDIQEIRNDVVNNVDETIRQAIGETFADPTVLSFPNYEKTPKRPGQIFQAQNKAGKSLAEAFHTIKSSSLSQETDVFIRRLDSDAQFSSGAFPSIFGGQSTSGSKTAAEYEQSRAQALQRLSTYWKMMSDFWSQFIGRASTQHARNLVELNYDERDVQKQGATFVNVFITLAELRGKVGHIEPEASDNFPISSAQKRALILQLLQMKNAVVERLMYHPQNSQLILDAIGMPEIHLPGADDRNKQLAEIGNLLKETSPDGMISSQPIDPDVDDHAVHAQVLRAWAVSELGQFAKEQMPDGYLNVILHLKEHGMALQQKTMEAGDTPANVPPETNATGNV